jgi:CRP-like cAMP-binding protein
MKDTDVLQPFAHLPSDIQGELVRQLHVRTFEAGEQVFEQGASASAFYIVASGRLKIVRVTPEGYENILCVRGPADYFCPVPLLDDGNQLGTAIAMTDVTLMWMERGAFLSLCEASPELLSIVQGDCLAEVRRLLNRLEVVAFRSVRERVAHALLTMSRQQADNGTPADELRLTQQELGALVGASRESVSRSLAQFERNGLVKLARGRVSIQDRAGLEKIAGQEDDA